MFLPVFGAVAPLAGIVLPAAYRRPETRHRRSGAMLCFQNDFWQVKPLYHGSLSAMAIPGDLRRSVI